MIKKLTLVETNCHNPHKNLALEKVLLDYVGKEEMIFYLWQNQNTVVIGKNQNAWKECALSEMKKDGITLARRISGGGAVFHDLGNLNFTFLMHKSNYDLKKQTKVILEAVKNIGIQAEFTGRNDLTVDDKKFSGNAYHFDKENAYHHGTILIDADMTRLANYLNVRADKMKAKGVSSVRSRVVNLREYQETLTVEKMKKALCEALASVYALCAEQEDEKKFHTQKWEALREQYQSEKFLLGENAVFETAVEGRFAWGGISLGLTSNAGVIETLQIDSDVMDTEFIESMKDALAGALFQKEAMAAALKNVPERFSDMKDDVHAMVMEAAF